MTAPAPPRPAGHREMLRRTGAGRVLHIPTAEDGALARCGVVLTRPRPRGRRARVVWCGLCEAARPWPEPEPGPGSP